MEDTVRKPPGRIARTVADMPIFTKLIVIYVAVLLVPTLGMAFMAAAGVRSSVTREVEESNRHFVRQVSAGIEARASVARSVAENLAYSHRIRSFLTQRFTMTPYTLNVYMNQVALLVTNAVSFHSGTLHEATLYLENHTIPEHWRLFLHTWRLSGIEWYESFVASGEMNGIVYPNTADHVALGESRDLRPVLTTIARIDTIDGRYLGIVTLDILERDIFAAVHEASDDERHFVVVDRDGAVVYAPAGQNPPGWNPDVLTITEPIPSLGLSVRAHLPMAELTQRTARASWTMVFSSLIGFALSVALAYVLLRILFAKVNTMIAAMHNVAEGDLSLRVPVTSNDELGQMANDLNYLIERVKALVNRIVVEEREKQEAQLAALQHQINPHFIYNTIDLFRMRLELDGIYETADAITNFGKMVRYTMAGDSVYASVGSEIENVRNFVALQRIRHGDRIRFSVRCLSDAELLPVMKLMLQPIVENSVIHGLKDDGSPLHISLEVDRRDDTVTVTLRDDGVGITAASLETIRGSIDAEDVAFVTRERTQAGIGLPNIVGRLRIFYGASGQLRIESQEGSGTTVTVRFPAIRPR